MTWQIIYNHNGHLVGGKKGHLDGRKVNKLGITRRLPYASFKKFVKVAAAGLIVDFIYIPIFLGKMLTLYPRDS